jgi:hypothetical protein
MKYPYLGYKLDEQDRMNVVFFTSEDEGVVVLDQTHEEGQTFGTNSTFNEDDYDFLPDKDSNGQEVCVRLAN